MKRMLSCDQVAGASRIAALLSGFCAREYHMPKDKDPGEVVETIRQSIKVSQRGERRVRGTGLRSFSATRR